VQGAVLPGRRAVVAVAVVEPRKDLSFASHLFLLEPGKPPRDLADRVLLGQRPYVSSRGKVYVVRGAPGPERVDALTLDEVDVRTGKAATVHAFNGYGALAVYRVTPEGGEFLTIHPDALGVTLHHRLYPLARDFTVDGRRGVFLYTTGDATGRWWVEELDLATGKTKQLAAGDSMALLPTVFPDGAVGVSKGRGKGLGPLAAQGEGHLRVRAFIGDTAAGLDERPDGSATPFAVDWKKGAKLPLPAPAGLRLDFAGVVQP
jgi:hypothetical protein